MEQLVELLTQIQDLAGMGIDALQKAGGKEASPKPAPEGEEASPKPAPEGEAGPPEQPPA